MGAAWAEAAADATNHQKKKHAYSIKNMNKAKLTSVLLASFLQFAPMAARSVQSMPLLVNSPVAIILKWAIGALAVAGTYHTVSAATARLVSATSITGTNGTRLSYQIRINDGSNRTPESWFINGTTFSASGSTTVGMPPGLSLGLTTGIISGTPNQAGTFPVSMTAYESPNRKGGSLTFTLTFTIIAVGSPPTITVQPVGGEAIAGTSFTFSVSANGSSPLFYQWQFGSTAIAKATNATLTFPSVQLTDAGSYTVVVSNAVGKVTSTPAVLTVKPPVVAPSITVPPQSISIHPGERFALSVVASGTEPLTYQWFRGEAPIPGAASATYALSASTAADAGSYTVQVSGPGGSVTSSAAVVEEVPLLVSIVSKGPQDASLIVKSIPGRSYAIEAATDLLSPSWTELRQITATGASTPFTDSDVSRNTRFWRYRPVP